MQISSKMVCASLDEEPGPCPEAVLLFLDCSSLVSHLLPSLISNCLHLPVGTQGRSEAEWSIFPVIKEVRGHRKALMPKSPHRALLNFRSWASQLGSHQGWRPLLLTSTSANIYWAPIISQKFSLPVSHLVLITTPQIYTQASTNLINWGSESLPNLLKFVN